MLLKIMGKVFGSKSERDVRKLNPILDRVNSLADTYRALTDQDLQNKTDEFRSKLKQGQTLDDILPDAFAVIREVTHRVLGEGRMVIDPVTKQEIPFMAHFDVQIMGGVVLHQGKAAEMKTGEGKTQVAALAAYLNALEGKGVHVITVNDYLAKRDSEWMGKIFNFMGLSVACLDTTEPGSSERREAYNCDITYGTNNEFGFDYLRDNMASSPEGCVQRELNYAIIDEVDNILIDEARTPLIISGPVTRSNKEYEELKPRVTKVVSAQNVLIKKVLSDVEKLLQDPEKEYEAGFKLLVAQKGAPRSKTLSTFLKEPGVAKIMKMVETDYLRERKLHEIDEELFYAIDESGHSAELTEKGRQLISESNPEFFVVPDLAEELGRIDNDESLDFEAKAEARDKAHREYAERTERIHCISQLIRAYSLFEKDVDYVVQEGQILIVDEFTGRILHGRRWSEGLHQAVEAKEGVRVAGENQTLSTITFQNYFKLYKKIAGMTGTAATEAAEFQEIYKLDVVSIPTNRPMVRVDHDDEIYKTQKEKYNAILDEIKRINEKGNPILVGTTSIEKSEHLSKMMAREGIKHEVLNAKQHAREASIVAQAGRLHAVMIATNMAGRGTDIVLGGNFEAMAANELIKEGIDPDDLTITEIREKHKKLYEQLKEEHDKVVEMGGLCIIGTERHEARRIDNQLRGRAGRQGDPGSSKFFLSLDDDLMRIFGSGRIASIMDRLGAEDGEVISHPLVSRSISSAQKRVEGRNFDQRKHLKEYDDVMNLQRTEIYGLRQRMLKGEDIKEEILEQLAAYVEEIIYKYSSKSKYAEDWDLKSLYEELQMAFGLTYHVPDEKLSSITHENMFDEIWKEVKDRYEEKESRFGADQMRQFERGVFLMVIDNLWKDHLYEMDHLKQGVQFRAFGQKNPLYEYQREALKAFDELRSAISREVSSFIFRLEAVKQEEDRMGLDHSRTVHAEFDVFSNVQAGQPEQAAGGAKARQPQLITNRAGGDGKPAPVRVEKHVGRNEPCPCGSGKKYKKCCGKA
ncbi:MAG: preprotein translocase subunit SecA [Chitinivibrionales bacterium]|nr:preprotein translocase subunit SecA [Chitinivibrionales bacterium]